uniref:Uncharacterized protein n=1 Tax=Arundo donax TaxID=35708 RepID=A0A0A8YPE3_ARUDO
MQQTHTSTTNLLLNGGKNVVLLRVNYVHGSLTHEEI